MFQPERFLDDTNNLKSGYETSAFGFGRRGKLLLHHRNCRQVEVSPACPGIPFAERSLWINIAMILWTFNIRKSEEPEPKTGLSFKYDDSDLAFSGEARRKIPRLFCSCDSDHVLQFSNAPFKFPAVFEPRSVHRAEVVGQEWAECEKDLNVLLPQHKER
jgi:hypothetical protein